MNERREQARLHQPWRALVALAELVLAAVAVWAAFRLWDSGVHTMTVTLTDGTVLTSTRWIGSWLAGAIGVGTVAAVLVVDAVREVLLAVRVRRRRKARDEDDFGYFAGHLNQA
ncbi:hypothetical protein GCM10027445_65210 [Amycolatopsis endophytica]|uniref:Uncharacterized protein n=1 Tax=Amycolatopsis endophytica TaxID=860233 RepID=A0A853AZC7_9PSEU|nr:hypothetical protein [Amycolatopsis endophytica]NYI87999.1 hypothetical protein [Amycolatopsis endophytica]